MISTNAIFSRKESQFEHEPCVVEKTIRLSGTEYDRFRRNMLADQDFISGNKEHMFFADGAHHCLLVVGEGRRDGVLVDSSGHDYARYAAFIPNAEDFLTMNRYPALAALNQRLIGIVDDAARQIEAVPSGERSEVDLLELETRHGIDLMRNGVLRDAVLDMLADRLEAPDFELDKNELIIHPAQGGEDRGGHHDRPERALPIEKPSVIEQIKEARQAAAPREKGSQKHKKDKGGPEL